MKAPPAKTNKKYNLCNSYKEFIPSL
jgi:hypothetical protein